MDVAIVTVTHPERSSNRWVSDAQKPLCTGILVCKIANMSSKATGTVTSTSKTGSSESTSSVTVQTDGTVMGTRFDFSAKFVELPRSEQKEENSGEKDAKAEQKSDEKDAKADEKKKDS